MPWHQDAQSGIFRNQSICCTSKLNPGDIINQFGKITDTYALLNTSLNLHGFPIVNDADDLIFVLENSQLDGCILENKLLIRA